MHSLIFLVFVTERNTVSMLPSVIKGALSCQGSKVNRVYQKHNGLCCICGLDDWMLPQKITKVQPFLPRLIIFPKKHEWFSSLKITLNYPSVSVNTFASASVSEGWCMRKRRMFICVWNVRFHLVTDARCVISAGFQSHPPSLSRILKSNEIYFMSGLSGSRHIFITPPPKHDNCSCDAKDVSSQNTK